MRRPILLAMLLAIATLAGCGPDDPSPSVVQTSKFDKFCTIEGLGSPIRETVLLIDAQAIVASTGETFRQNNPVLFALVMGLGNPDRAVETGAIAPRERITLLVGDAVSGSTTPLFTGCVPGISQQELAARKAAGNDGALTKYFGSDMSSEIQKSREEFQKRILVALVQAKPGAKSSMTDSFETSSFARLLRSAGTGSTTDNLIRRIFIFADPAKSISKQFASYSEAREAGFTSAAAVQANLGLTEAYIVPSGGAVSSLNEAFLSAFLLSSGADLRRVTPFSPDGLGPVPTKIVRYSGELPLAPNVMSPMDIRLATTASGDLVSSWISYSASKGVRATPITGQFSCSDEDHCTLRGDPNGGLGQRWRTDPGPAPQPLPEGPFGGMRIIEATETAGRLSGRIFDPIIFVGSAGDLKFEAKRVEGGK